MKSIKTGLLIVFLLLSASQAWAQEGDAKLQVLVPGERFDLGNGIYGTWEFTQKPQIGMVILKIQLFDKNDTQISPYEISGDSGMPSMPGHHDSGDVPFKLNKKQNYLLPVNVVMPGDWEVKLTFRSGETIVHRAAVRFDV
jgi:hypothetical protein